MNVVGAHIPRKAVCVPCSPPVDISGFLPLVDHPLLQKLRCRKQLGVNALVFPGAVHTRFEHTIGVLGMTQRLCHLHGIANGERKLLCAYALLHDIGHGPFSHQIEPVIGGSHKENGLQCLLEMHDAIQACGLEPERLAAMLSGDDPLASFVSDRNLGTDKLDYLQRDALHIGFTGMPDIEKVAAYCRITDGVWAIEEKFIEDIKRIQKFYTYLHQHGYLNKTALSVQRVFQRAIQEELEASGAAAESLWRMTDAELERWLRCGRSTLAQRLVETFDNRGFHRTIYAIKPYGYGFVERGRTDQVRVDEWSREKLRAFSDSVADCAKLRELENDLAALLSLAPGDVLFAAMPFFAKLIPRDVRVFSAVNDREYWLFENDKDHYRSLLGDYLRTFSIRVIVLPAQREQTAARTRLIGEFLEEWLLGAGGEDGAETQ